MGWFEKLEVEVFVKDLCVSFQEELKKPSSWVCLKVVVFKRCDSTLMARWTTFFKEEYSCNSTKSLISLLNPLTNLAILNSSLSCILFLNLESIHLPSYILDEAVGTSTSVPSYKEEEQTSRTCMPLNHIKRSRLAFRLAQCPLQVCATIGWHSLRKLRKLT